MKHWRTNLSALLLLAVALLPQVVAQTVITTHDARSSAMGGCFMPDTGRLHVRLSYRQAYLMPELADKSIGIGSHLGSYGHLSASYSHFGDANFFQQQAAASYCLQMADWLLAAAGLAYSNTGTADPHYIPTHWLSAEAAVQFKPSDNLLLTVAATSPASLKSPFRWQLQAAYKPSSRLTTLVEADFGTHNRLRTGLEYAYGNCLFARVGLSTAPLAPSFGVGINYAHLRFDLSAELHSALGLSPHTSLTLWL